jgi:hypothetical protein
MVMEIHEKYDCVREVVREYFTQNGTPENLGSMFQSDDEIEHIIEIGTSILMTKWGIGYPGGSFVQAIVDNDLQEAIGRADSVNIKALKFYVQLKYNTGMPRAIMN